jgi:hypothetical protein
LITSSCALRPSLHHRCWVFRLAQSAANAPLPSRQDDAQRPSYYGHLPRPSQQSRDLRCSISPVGAFETCRRRSVLGNSCVAGHLTGLAISSSGKSTAATRFTCPAPFAKIFLFARTPNHFYIRCHPVPQRGGSRSSRTRGGMRWTRQRPRVRRDRRAGFIKSVSDHRARRRTALLRTAKSCGPDASTPASSLRRLVGPTGIRQASIRKRR